MRKIQTQSQIDKRKRKNQFIVGGILIFLMVMSTLGYSLIRGEDGDNTSSVSENGLDFVKQNGLWMTQIDGVIFAFQNLPSEVSDIGVNTSISLNEYYDQPLYFVSPNEAASEVITNIGKYMLRYQEACLNNETCAGDLPIKDCINNIIIFEGGNESYVYQEGNCVFVVGDSMRATDAFLYKVLQII